MASPPRQSVTHATEEAARKRLSSLLSSDWVWREQTGRDHGIDGQFELLLNGVATGRVPLLQVKGTAQDHPPEHLDIEVKTPLYAELFAAPLLLVVVPPAPSPARYLWLQQYLRSALPDNPDWRQQQTTRVPVPASNPLPGDEARLPFIAGHPVRLHLLRRPEHISATALSAIALPSNTADQHGIRWLLATRVQHAAASVVLALDVMFDARLAAGVAEFQGEAPPY